MTREPFWSPTLCMRNWFQFFGNQTALDGALREDERDGLAD